LELRTTFHIEPQAEKISYDHPVMFLGSCFATSVGTKMERGRMEVVINPAGAVYNPVSVSQTLNNIVSRREFVQEDLYYSDGEWISFSHHTDFSSGDPVHLLSKINGKSKEASDFLTRARFLFITFGTARVFRFTGSGKIVSNCHKVPAAMFQRELLTVDEIIKIWSSQLEELNNLYPNLRVIFTISPVRHWKDGAHGNQISKAVLFLAVEELLKHQSKPHYFPAYELLMDDLRDYRFYADDMLHPSQSAIDYIWDAFSNCYLENKTIGLINEVTKITSACEHRFNTDSTSKRIRFAQTMIRKIEAVRIKIPSADFSEELKYFMSLL
jgi:hypothetical protein